MISPYRQGTVGTSALLVFLACLVLQTQGAADDALFTLDGSADHTLYRINEFRRAREQLADYFSTHSQDAAPRTPVQAEQGIVISAGGRRLLTNAYVVVKVVREAHSCSLPIEIFYDGEEEADRTVLDALQLVPDVLLRDASHLRRPDYLAPWPTSLHGYAKKVFSIYSTGFRKVLAIDSDCQPLVNPAGLFDMPEFKEHGAVFWPDYWKANTAREAPQAEIYELLGIEVPWIGNPDWAATESGQLLLDKERHGDVLDWVMWLNIWSDVVYELVLGDKDTFEMGFMLAGKHAAFHRIPTPPRTALTAKTEEVKDMFHVGMVQSVEGRPSFLHRTSGGKFDAGKSVNEHFRPAYFTEPMSVAAAKQFIWDTALAVNMLPGHAVSLALPPCKALDPLTIQVLRPLFTARAVIRSMRKAASRYSRCKVHRQDPNTADITVLPIQLYGDDTVRAVSYSYIAFQELRNILKHEEAAVKRKASTTGLP